MSVTLLQADARAIPLADRSVQCVVTSPPYYGLRDYKVSGQIGVERTPESYVAALVDVFREVRRVLKDDGTVWLNLGDSYATNGGAHGGRSDNQSGVGAKRTHAAGAGDQDPRRAPSGLKPKDLIGIPWRVAFALQADGWYLRQDIIWHKPNPMPESVRDRCTKAHEYLFLLTKSERYYFDAEAIKEPSTGVTGGGFSKAYAESQPKHGAMTLTRPRDTGRRNKRSVWTITPKPFKGAHFATFPPALVEPCVLAGSRPGDVVLDPFGGSGTTGLVARGHGRSAVLLDLNPNYLAIAQARLDGQPVTHTPDKQAGHGRRHAGFNARWKESLTCA